MDSEPYDWQPAFDVILEEARRSLDEQKADLAALRARSGALIGYGGLIAGLAGISISEVSGPIAVVLGISLVGLFAAGACAVIVLTPWELCFNLGVDGMNAWFEGEPAPEGVDHIIRAVTDAHGANYLSNKVTIDRLQWVYVGGIGGLVFQSLLMFSAVVVELGT